MRGIPCASEKEAAADMERWVFGLFFVIVVFKSAPMGKSQLWDPRADVLFSRTTRMIFWKQWLVFRHPPFPA